MVLQNSLRLKERAIFTKELLHFANKLRKYIIFRFKQLKHFLFIYTITGLHSTVEHNSLIREYYRSIMILTY